jgi:hypothetical protein
MSVKVNGAHIVDLTNYVRSVTFAIRNPSVLIEKPRVGPKKIN